MSSMSALPKYTFQYSKRGDFDLNDEEVYLIMDEESSRIAERNLEDENVLYVDCEGHYFGSYRQLLGSIQIATQSAKCFIFHITKYRECLTFLKPLFESDEVRKVFHDCSGDSSVLRANGIRLKNVDDTQIAHKVIESDMHSKPINRETGPPLHDLYRIYCNGQIPIHSPSKNSDKPHGENKWISLCMPDEHMIKKSAVDVLALRKIFIAQQRNPNFSRNLEYERCVKEQLKRKIGNDLLEESKTNEVTSYMFESDPTTSDQAEGQMGTFICNPVRHSPRRAESSSGNLGWIAVGAVAAVTIGAIAASFSQRRSEQERRENPTNSETRRENPFQQSRNSSGNNKQKEDGCTIS